jgi:apolipoprotein D and lipocalin family protein
MTHETTMNRTATNFFNTIRMGRVLSIIAVCLLAACASKPTNPNPRASEPLKLAKVDLPRYMGHWYIVGEIPYSGEKDYVAGQAEWKLRDDGKIDDDYIGRKGSFGVPETKRSFVDTIVPDTDDAHWRVRIVWPVSIDQLTLYVDPMYQVTLLGYPDKSLGWIFSRTPYLSEAKYQEMLTRFDEQGYDISKFRRVPQQAEQMHKPGFHTPGDKD